jgi:hypothetical protein
MLAVVNLSDFFAYSLPPTITALAGLGVAFLNYKTSRRSERKLHSIDHAVNGVAEGEPTLREETQAINSAVNGAPSQDPSIRENVETLVERRDLDPEVER